MQWLQWCLCLLLPAYPKGVWLVVSRAMAAPRGMQQADISQCLTPRAPFAQIYGSNMFGHFVANIAELFQRKKNKQLSVGEWHEQKPCCQMRSCIYYFYKFFSLCFLSLLDELALPRDRWYRYSFPLLPCALVAGCVLELGSSGSAQG